MNTRRKVIIAFIALLTIAGVLRWVLHPNSQVPEASYQGKSTTYWLENVGTYGLQGPALRAFREMGTNAYPVVLAALDSKEDPPAYRRLRTRLSSIPYLGRLCAGPSEQQTLLAGARAIALNPDSLSLTPTLLELVSPTNYLSRQYALGFLIPGHGRADPNLVPLLASDLTDKYTGVKLGALNALGDLGPIASNAVPAISNACRDTDDQVRIFAALELWRVSQNTNTSVPVLEAALNLNSASLRDQVALQLQAMEGNRPALMSIFLEDLTNSERRIRINSCVSLYSYGRAAKTAVPALLTLLRDPDPRLQSAAKAALQVIDPEAAATNSLPQ